jgi:hypothetical protein
MTERGLVSLRDVKGAGSQKSIIPIGYKNVFADSYFQQAEGMDELRSGTIRLLREAVGREPQMLRQKIGGDVVFSCQRRKIAIADQAVDIFFLEAGVFNGLCASFQMEAKGCSPRHLSLWGEAYSNNGVLISHIHAT